jgi:hypothetical protein
LLSGIAWWRHRGEAGELAQAPVRVEKE